MTSYFRIISVLSGIKKEGGKTTSPSLLVSLYFQLSFSLPFLGGRHAGKLLSSVMIVFLSVEKEPLNILASFSFTDQVFSAE